MLMHFTDDLRGIINQLISVPQSTFGIPHHTDIKDVFLYFRREKCRLRFEIIIRYEREWAAKESKGR